MRLLPLLLILGWAAPASAHDFWLQPQRFRTVVRSPTPIAILVGHGADRAPWGVGSDRVLMLRSIGPNGVADHLAAVRARPVADVPPMSFGAPGTHIVALQSGHAVSELPGVRFTNYLKEEGLTPALAARTRNRTSNAAGREIYSRRAKALIQVGPGGAAQPHVTRPVGMTLEIVPERDPYAPSRTTALPIRVLYEGRPLAGALVKLTNLAADEKPVATALTNGVGRAVFTVPRTGSCCSATWRRTAASSTSDD